MIEVNDATLKLFSKKWRSNLKENVEGGLWEKHGALRTGCLNLGSGKAFVGIGAGGSYNTNKDVLKRVMHIDGRKNWEDRNFMFGACNHQLKPLLKDGMIPDFVFLVDSSDVTYPQLCEDIPSIGQSVTLVVPLHASPKVVNEWDKQGRPIKFYSSSAKVLKKALTRMTGQDADYFSIVNGGNVINSMTSIAAKVFGCDVFIGVGNDLCFEIKDDKEEQNKSYYADGDYSTNAAATGTGRDEAACPKKWLGFKIRETNLVDTSGNPKLVIEGGKIVGTSHTLWVYKTWMEEAMIFQSSTKDSTFRYYNCSEGGILGVMAHSIDDKEMKKDSNWYMLDDVCKKWHTTTLEIATKQFAQAKEMVKWKNGDLLDVQPARALAQAS